MYHKANLNRIMSDYTGKPLAKIEEDTDRDRCDDGALMFGAGAPLLDTAADTSCAVGGGGWVGGMGRRSCSMQRKPDLADAPSAQQQHGNHHPPLHHHRHTRRYMSPIEAREYGIIDHIIGGDEAVFKVKGSNKRFPAVKVRRTGGGGGARCLGRGAAPEPGLAFGERGPARRACSNSYAGGASGVNVTHAEP